MSQCDSDKTTSCCSAKDDNAIKTEASACCGPEKTEPKVSSCCSTSKPATESSCCGSEQKNNATSSCCGSTATAEADDGGCCGAEQKGRIDWILWICTPLVVLGYIAYLMIADTAHQHEGHEMQMAWWQVMMHTSYEMVNAMWWGILSAALFVGILGRIPRELIMSILGRGGSKRGLFRATLAGLMLDLCNHGILMVGMKLYERGASTGQVMAFLIASPWNSLTLTLILVGLIGLPWTLLFILASLVIALISGWVFDRLTERGTLPANPYQQEFQQVPFWPTLKQTLRDEDWSLAAWGQLFWQGLKESKMVLRWVVFGVVLVALIRAFVPEESFGVWFGASMSGLLLTLLATTVMEVCSEGSSPIAADLFNRAGAPGNAFTFLMAGAATDYTEIMALRDTTKSWKIAMFLPLITVPQVLLIGWLMNTTVG